MIKMPDVERDGRVTILHDPSDDEVRITFTTRLDVFYMKPNRGELFADYVARVIKFVYSVNLYDTRLSTPYRHPKS